MQLLTMSVNGLSYLRLDTTFGGWKYGLNRIEPKGSLRYRIVYAYEPKSLQYHVLAIVHRDFDYKTDHEITKRILKAYNDLGITIH